MELVFGIERPLENVQQYLKIMNFLYNEGGQGGFGKGGAKGGPHRTWLELGIFFK